MMRIEIIANRSVEENILEALKDEGVGKYYTMYPNVFGVGSSGPRMGDAIWPEENFALVFWCDYEEALGIESAVAYVKEHFPDEGIKIFGLPDHENTRGAVPVRTGASPETAGKVPDTKEAPVNRYDPFQAETGPTADRFTAEERNSGAGQFNRFDLEAEAERSAAVPADVDNWLSRQGAVQGVHYAPPVGRPVVQESAPAASPPDSRAGPDGQAQPEADPQALPVPQPLPSPEPERMPPQDSNNSGMEDENL
ncbi:MAG: hypothetical protein LBP76_14915 [Treponema sp.]|jgi:hypothetical protein|nr:hypothetical protein [Treponema sp.]